MNTVPGRLLLVLALAGVGGGIFAGASILSRATPADETSRSQPSALLALTSPRAVRGQPQAPPGCGENEAYHRLDFWVGSWEVHVGERKVGDNRIEKILDGCALMEHWSAASGGEGKSLFYHVPATGTWKQVWVTARATRPGGLKEKTLDADYDGPGVRFQGRIALPNGGEVLDRTTLTPLDAGRVRQVIETSSDGGETWAVRFDAAYHPVDSDG